MSILDLFCGAGGSSDGARAAGGEVRVAVNHSQLAVDTHAANFPDVDHDCTDISGCDPHRYPKTTMLVASPDCTHHTNADSKAKPTSQTSMWEEEETEEEKAAERSRATMLDVIKFARLHQYRLIVIENVVQVTKWRYYQHWLDEMDAIGYEHKELFFNSMFFGVSQSRDRVYIVFWLKGTPAPKLDYRPSAYCVRCERTVEAVQSWKKPANPRGKYGLKTGQYVYRCPHCAGIVEPTRGIALDVIDWTLPIERIGDRKHPLRPKTQERICNGILKFGEGRAGGATASSTTYTSNNNNNDNQSQVGAPPFVLETLYSHANNDRTRGLSEALPTQTTRQSLGLTAPFAMGTGPGPVKTNGNKSQPFMVGLRKNHPGRGLDEPLATVVAGGNHHYVTMPQTLDSLLGLAPGATSPQHQQPYITANKPLLNEALSAFILSYYSRDNCHSLFDPLGTLSTRHRHALLQYIGGGGQQSTELSFNPATPTGARAVTGPTRLEDWYFRMLKVSEIQRAMAFRDNYLLKGNARDMVRLLGQAVTPPVMEWIIRQCLAVLGAPGLAQLQEQN